MDEDEALALMQSASLDREDVSIADFAQALSTPILRFRYIDARKGQWMAKHIPEGIEVNLTLGMIIFGGAAIIATIFFVLKALTATKDFDDDELREAIEKAPSGTITTTKMTEYEEGMYDVDFTLSTGEARISFLPDPETGAGGGGWAWLLPNGAVVPASGKKGGLLIKQAEREGFM